MKIIVPLITFLSTTMNTFKNFKKVSIPSEIENYLDFHVISYKTIT